jgi:hypothetical protein
MINDVLQTVLSEKSLIGIRTLREDWDESLIGFVTNLNDHSVTLNEIDKDGNSTGNTIILLSDIVSLDFDDRYQRRLNLIFKNRDQLKINDQITVWLTGKDLSDHLNTVIKTGNIVTLFFEEDVYVLGIIKAIDSEWILVHNIGVEGDDDGESYHLIENIVGIKYSGVDEQKVSILYKSKDVLNK